MTAAYSLTPQMSAALSFVRSYIAEHGFAPSYDEIAAALALASKCSVARLVDQMEARGVVRRIPRCARSLTPVAAAPKDDGPRPDTSPDIHAGDLPRPVEKRCATPTCKAYYVTTYSRQQHCWNCKVRELQSARTPAWLVESD